MKCWFDADGNLINIGEWDYQISHFEVGTQEVEIDVPDDYALQPGESWVDETPGAKRIRRTEPVYEDRPTNPLPPGAYFEERAVEQDEDGGWHVVGQPRPITLQERLKATEDMMLEILLGGV